MNGMCGFNQRGGQRFGELNFGLEDGTSNGGQSQELSLRVLKIALAFEKQDGTRRTCLRDDLFANANQPLGKSIGKKGINRGFCREVTDPL